MIMVTIMNWLLSSTVQLRSCESIVSSTAVGDFGSLSAEPRWSADNENSIAGADLGPGCQIFTEQI